MHELISESMNKDLRASNGDISDIPDFIETTQLEHRVF